MVLCGMHNLEEYNKVFNAMAELNLFGYRSDWLKTEEYDSKVEVVFVINSGVLVKIKEKLWRGYLSCNLGELIDS